MSETAFILPQPTAKLKEHSDRLTDKILRRIRSEGPISFNDYMEMALYEPGLGYYSAGLAKIGQAGDFITAPELGPMFARCLAKTVGAATEYIQDYSVLELGAGSGIMAADLLDSLAANRPANYLILERSADLADRQRQLLSRRHPEYFDRIQWLHEPPANFDGIIIGNEVVDALPVERFVLSSGEALQVVVDEKDGRLVETTRPAPAALSELIFKTVPGDFITSPGLFTSEINPFLTAWLSGVTAGLGDGLVILCDYGYPRSDYYDSGRNRGTLLCHYRHRAHDDALFWPGLQDITASVDFTALAEASDAAGLDLLTYTSQAGFMIDAGLEDIMQDPEKIGERGRIAQAEQVKKLTLPGEMGERFQFMVTGRNMPGNLPGLNGPDYRYRL